MTLAKTTGQSNVGLCLDTWEWFVGGGNLEQLEDIDPQVVVTELRLGDAPAGADLKTIEKNQRTRLPGEDQDSFSVAVAACLI